MSKAQILRPSYTELELEIIKLREQNRRLKEAIARARKVAKYANMGNGVMYVPNVLAALRLRK